MNVKVLVPISGGKDSQACLKLALQHYDPSEVRGLFCDTQFEHPITYAHIEKLKTLYGNIQIDVVSGGSVLEQSLKYRRFPGGGARHCTDQLKIRQTKIYLKNLITTQKESFQVWYGMRSSESNERAKRYENKISSELYFPHEILPSNYPKYLGKMGVTFRLPILDWGSDQVFSFLSGEENPLYKAGFERVGCFPCLAAGDKYKEKCFNFDSFGKSQYESVILVSDIIKKDVWTSKSGKERNSVCSLVCED